MLTCSNTFLVNTLAPGRKRKASEYAQTCSTSPEPSHRTRSIHWLTRSALRKLGNYQLGIAHEAAPIQRADCLRPSTDLKRFARQGGPDCTDLRGFPIVKSKTSFAPSIIPTSMGRSRSGKSVSGSSAGASSRKSRAYDRNFEQKMSDGGVYMDDTEEPRNIGEIDDMISQRRPSLSPTTFPEADFRAFKAANRGCLNEPMVMRDSFSIVRGETQIFSADKVTFDNLEPLIDDSMSDAQPDSYDGISPRLIPLHIRQELHEYIVPSKHEHGPALPNFLAEVKGPSGSEQVVQRQACYVAALGARGMHKLQEYVARSVRQFDRNAYTISTTYSWGSLKCYTTHLSPSSRRDGSIDYHMYQVGGWDLTGSAQQCREGMSAFRNCREWAQEQRDKWVALAVCRDSPSGTSIDGSASPGPEDSECSPDELGNEYGSKGSTHGARHLNKRLRVR